MLKKTTAIDFFRVHILLTDTIILGIILFLGRFLLKQFLNIDIESIIATNNNGLYTLYVNTSIALLGFLVTGVGVIIIFLSNTKISALEGTKHPKYIVNIYFSTIRYMGVLAVSCFTGIIKPDLPYLPLFVLVVLFLAIIRFIRCIWITEKIAILIYSK